jgi:hypothetical protein
MWALIGISVVVLLGFAIFVLQYDADEPNRNIERDRLW